VLETGVAASVIAVGFLLVMTMSMYRAAQLGLTGLFAVLHGLAHGAELDLAEGVFVISGMLLATALLHAVGLLIAAKSLKISRQLHALLGWMVMLTGGYILLAAT